MEVGILVRERVVRCHNLPGGFPAISSATIDQSLYLTLVRGNTSGLVCLFVVFPNRAPGGLRLRSLAGGQNQPTLLDTSWAVTAVHPDLVGFNHLG